VNDAFEEIAPHVFRHKEHGGQYLSAERTWSHLRENLRRMAAILDSRTEKEPT
jgi:hypothetical protein